MKYVVGRVLWWSRGAVPLWVGGGGEGVNLAGRLGGVRDLLCRGAEAIIMMVLIVISNLREVLGSKCLGLEVNVGKYVAVYVFWSEGVNLVNLLNAKRGKKRGCRCFCWRRR